jgi:hypothetical protein
MSREQRRQDRFIRQAHFKPRASVAEIDYQHPRNIKPSQVVQLASGDWKCLTDLRAYVWSAVVAHNLALFSRLKAT